MDSVDSKDLKKLIKTMRENGVLKLKTSAIELELAPSSLFPQAKGEAIEQGKVLTPQQSAIQTAAWSAPGGEPFTEDEQNDIAEILRQ